VERLRKKTELAIGLDWHVRGHRVVSATDAEPETEVEPVVTALLFVLELHVGMRRRVLILVRRHRVVRTLIRSELLAIAHVLAERGVLRFGGCLRRISRGHVALRVLMLRVLLLRVLLLRVLLLRVPRVLLW